MDSLRSLKLHLSLIKGFGPASYVLIERWLQHAVCDISELYSYSVQQLQRIGFGEEQAERVYYGLADKSLLQREEELLHKHAVRVIVRGDQEYPILLTTIHAPPLVVYAQGSLKLLSAPAVAIVGSREAHAYGKAVVDLFVPPLVNAGYTIVSGGARGIDAFAHKAAMVSGGKTIAVLGSGLLHPYPRENSGLFTEIAASGGAVISPFSLQTQPLAANFPARNRIIAGMSRGCIVVQAAARSGALITAAYALQEGRDVAVVPGSVFDPLSAGCHKLLAEGATPLCSVEDVRLFIGIEASKVSTVVGAVGAASGNTYTDPLLLACHRPCSFDELLQAALCTPQQLHDRLWQLQIDGSIEQTATGLWKRSG